MSSTDTTVKQLIINTLSQEDYEGLTSPSDTELYLTPDTTATEISTAISDHNTSSTAHADIRTLVASKIDTSQKGVASGVASLDSNGKVPLTQMNDAVLGNVAYQGTWDAENNVPYLTNPAGSLPTGYQELNYIEFTNAQYIDTNILWDANTDKMKYEFSFTSSQTYNNLFGAGTSQSSQSGNYILNSTGTVFLSGNAGYLYGHALMSVYTAGLGSSYDTTQPCTGILEASLSGQYYTLQINSGTVQTKNLTNVGVTHTNSIYLGAIHIDGSTPAHSRKFTGKIHYFRVYKDDVLVGNFVPAMRESDSVYGFYDLVTNTFFTNAGTGTLTGGGEITIPKGHYYITSVAGTQFGITFDVGDWIISQGNSWGKVANTDAVPSVQGRTGNVVIIDDTLSTATSYTWSIDKLKTEFALPSRTGQDEKFLKTTSSGLQWATVSSGGGTWGSITGTLSNQTDLQSALDAKQATITAGTGIGISNNAIGINQVATVSSNVTVTGTITDAFGVLSGFGTGNYATIPTTFNPGTDSWELVIKCKTPATLPSRYAYLYGTAQGSNSIVVGLYSDGTMTLWLSSTGSSTWDICSDQRGTTVLSTNTDYMVSVAFDGTSTYTLSLSTDGGTNWTTEITVTSSSNVHSGTIDLGSAYDHDSATVWGGSIDLNSSGLEITLQGEVWSGMLTDTNIAKATGNLYGLVKPDNSTITISDGVISAVGGGGTYTAGTGIDITNNVISSTLINDTSTSQTNTWSANKLNTEIGNVESALLALRGNV